MQRKIALLTLTVATFLALTQASSAQKKVTRPEPDRPASTDESRKSPDAPESEGVPDSQSKEASPGSSSDKDQERKKPKPPEVATFGGGCFWSIEAIFERIPGVLSVDSGFSGGSVPNPTYAMVCTGMTGHAEVVNITFDPNVLSYEKLLAIFWKVHNPTTPNAQGDDFGPQYRSIILYHSAEQRDAARKVYAELKAKKVYRAPIVTELYPFKAFYPAEPYHQDYFRTRPYSTYSQAYIVPKLRKLKLR